VDVEKQALQVVMMHVGLQHSLMSVAFVVVMVLQMAHVIVMEIQLIVLAIVVVMLRLMRVVFVVEVTTRVFLITINLQFKPHILLTLI
jgi:hypothetical protein